MHTLNPNMCSPFASLAVQKKIFTCFAHMGVMQRLLLFAQVDSATVAVNSRHLCRAVQLFLRFKAHFDVIFFCLV